MILLIRSTIISVVFLLLSVQDSPAQSGQFTTVFKEYHPLSHYGAITKRMGYKPLPDRSNGHDYNIEEESFELYVPPDYSPQEAYGLLVWISPSERGTIPADWKVLMDKYKLIWAGANKTGNQHYTDTRRIPLTLDVAYNMQKRYNIHPERVYVAGLSGGGRVASMVAMHYPDVFTGGIFIIGANYWEKMFIPGEPRKYWNAGMPKPQSRYLSLANQRGRYVFLTGDTDGNRPQMHAYFRLGYRKYLKNVVYLQVPGMGHEKPPVEWFETSLKYIDQGRSGYQERKPVQPPPPSGDMSHRKGRFTAVFHRYHPLSHYDSVVTRMHYKRVKNWPSGHHYAIEQERFEVVVPDSYDPEVPSGLLVWVSASPYGGIPRQWIPLLDKHRLLWVGADNAGNKEHVYTRRIPLALDAVENMKALYNIDENRIYISGISGGGRVASRAAIHFSDVFTGGIFVVGADFWEKVIAPGYKNKFWEPFMTKPRPQYLSHAAIHSRLVLLTGDNDSNRSQMKAYYDRGYRKYFKHVLYLQVPDMGHTLPPADWYEQGIEYLDQGVINAE